MSIDPSVLQAARAAINTISNSITKARAQIILSEAIAVGGTRGQFTLEILNQVLGSSAKKDGTALFYSGKDKAGNSNYDLAEQCQGILGDDQAYFYHETEAGGIIEGLKGQLLDDDVAISGAFEKFSRLGSSMFADAADAAIAFVENSTNTSTYQTFFLDEMPTLLENGTNTNGLDLSQYSDSDPQSVHDLVGNFSQCFDNFPPTGTAPVTEPGHLQNPDSTWGAIGDVMEWMWDKAAEGAEWISENPGTAAAGVGLGIGIGACIVASSGLCAAGLGVLGIGISSAAADEMPTPPTGNDPADHYLYQSELSAYYAANMAQDLFYYGMLSGVSNGDFPPSVLSEFAGFDPGLGSLQTFLNANPDGNFTFDYVDENGGVENYWLQTNETNNGQTIELVDLTGTVVQTMQESTNNEVQITDHGVVDGIVWDEHVTQVDGEGNITSDYYDYASTTDSWFQDYDLSDINFDDFGEAEADQFITSIERQLYYGDEGGIPNIFSADNGFSPYYDFSHSYLNIDSAGFSSTDGIIETTIALEEFDWDSHWEDQWNEDDWGTYNSYDWSYDTTGLDYNYQDWAWEDTNDSYTTYSFDDWSWGGWIDPVIIDLDGDGVNITPRETSNADFDIDGDGFDEHVAWAGPGDGILVIDLDEDGNAGPDGIIDRLEEFSFTADATDARTDMEALRELYDSNNDGVLDSQDDRWGDFRIWIDHNLDGWDDRDDDGTPLELYTLESQNITSISLVHDD